LTINGQELTLDLAGATTTGALTFDDWNMFANKQDPLAYTPEDIANKIVFFDGLETDAQYPSALLVSSELALKANLAGAAFTGPIIVPTINGFTLPVGNGTNGQLLTSDGIGGMSWTTPNSSWSLTVNAGTIAGKNFIGKTDNIDLVFKVNNFESGRIANATFNTSIGYQTLLTNTTGIRNAVFGYQALANNLWGVNNTAVGYQAMNTNTYGNHNTAVGYLAGNYVVITAQPNPTATNGVYIV